jgi:lambda family phage portal protein
VFGPDGIGYESQVKRRDNGKVLDEELNTVLEEWWKRFSDNCDVERHLTLQEMEALAGRGEWRDGESMIMIHDAWDGNPEGLGFEVIDPERIDVRYNEELRGGRRVEMGIQYTASGVIEGYHLSDAPRAKPYAELTPSRPRRFLPASRMIHTFYKTEPNQRRGYSHLSAVMRQLSWLDGFFEAAVVAARGGAIHGGFFRDAGEDSGMTDFDGEDDFGNTIMQAEPGEYRYIGNLDFQPTDPNYPHAMFEMFTSSMLKSIASALPASYHSISGDLSSVNYTSLRHEKVNEWKGWDACQQFQIRKKRVPIFELALERAILTGRIELPGRFAFTRESDFAFLNKPRWMPTVMEPIDPFKEEQSNDLMLQNNLISRRRLILANNEDPATIDREIAADPMHPKPRTGSTAPPPAEQEED